MTAGHALSTQSTHCETEERLPSNTTASTATLPFDCFLFERPVDGLPPTCDWMTTFQSFLVGQDLRREPIDVHLIRPGSTMEQKCVKIVKGFPRLTVLFYILEHASQLDPSSPDLDMITPSRPRLCASKLPSKCAALCHCET